MRRVICVSKSPRFRQKVSQQLKGKEDLKVQQTESYAAAEEYLLSDPTDLIVVDGEGHVRVVADFIATVRDRHTHFKGKIAIWKKGSPQVTHGADYCFNEANKLEQFLRNY